MIDRWSDEEDLSTTNSKHTPPEKTEKASANEQTHVS